jgi:hypothetical protein
MVILDLYGGIGTLESRMMMSVEQIFDLQERCLQHALPVVMERFTFVKECLEVMINRHVHEEVINELDDEDRERIRWVHKYLNETISHLVISLKLALYGAHVEPLTLLRNALERMACMAAMVENTNLKPPLTYRTAFKNITARREIQRLHGELSTYVVHVGKSISPPFILDGKSYPRVGMAIDPERNRFVIGELARGSLYVVYALTDFYNLKREMVGEAYFQQVNSLENKFSTLI